MNDAQFREASQCRLRSAIHLHFFKPVINLNKDWLNMHFKFSLILATTLSSSALTLTIIICNAVVKIMRRFVVDVVLCVLTAELWCEMSF